jgi:hypothetical protein
MATSSLPKLNIINCGLTQDRPHKHTDLSKLQSNSVTTSWKGSNILYGYKMSVVLTEEYNVTVNSEELIGTTEYLTL